MRRTLLADRSPRTFYQRFLIFAADPTQGRWQLVVYDINAAHAELGSG